MSIETPQHIIGQDSSLQITKRDEILKILIEGHTIGLDSFVQELAKKNNPRLLSIIKVENLFKEHGEFNSRNHLSRVLNGSMKGSAINTIIARLVNENKVAVNEDRSLTWIDIEGNEILNKQFDKAVPL